MTKEQCEEEITGYSTVSSGRVVPPVRRKASQDRIAIPIVRRIGSGRSSWLRCPV